MPGRSQQRRRVNPVDRFDEPFFPDAGDSSGASPEEWPEFLKADWHGVNEHEFPQAPQEKSSYADNPIRVYLREMGSVPLLPAVKNLIRSPAVVPQELPVSFGNRTGATAIVKWLP